MQWGKKATFQKWGKSRSEFRQNQKPNINMKAVSANVSLFLFHSYQTMK